MNNKNNNKIFISKIFLLLFNFPKNIISNKNNLNKIISFQGGENFLQNLQKTCEENHINMGVSLKNYNKIIHGNFENISLKKVLKICFDDNYYIESFDNFIHVKEKDLVTKIYNISSYVNKDQLITIENFLNEMVKNLGGEFILNKEDGCVFVKTLEKNQVIIKEYIDNINFNLNKQVILECNIITISKNKNNNKNLNLIGIGKNLLNNKNNKIGDSLNLINLGENLLFSEVDDVLRFLSKTYNTDSIFNIKILMYNKQICQFKTEELRYSNSHYDTKILNNMEDVNEFTDDNIKNNKVIRKNSYNNIKPYVVKNLKSFTSGVNLEITPHINNNHVILNINFNKSNFNENKKNEDLPHIITNSLVSSIKVKFNDIIVLNGLKNTVTKKIIKNETPFKILNFFFSSEEIVENECEILFLIKVTKME